MKKQPNNKNKTERKSRDRKNPKAAAAMIGILLAVVFSASAVFSWKQANTKPDGSTAAVYQNGVMVKEISESRPETFRVEGENGWNEIEVTKDGIRITDASCPDKICTYTTWIGSGSLPIVCVPNHLVIMTNQTEDSELDVITY